MSRCLQINILLNLSNLHRGYLEPLSQFSLSVLSILTVINPTIDPVHSSNADNCQLKYLKTCIHHDSFSKGR